MIRRNYGKSHKQLWEIANRVIGQCGPSSAHTDEFGTEVSKDDIKIATDSGFVKWDEGGAAPTREFNFWDGRFS